MKARMVSASLFTLLLVGLLMLAFCCQLGVAETVNVETGLAGYWKFDEASGQIAYDSSGNGNDGQIYGASWVDGKKGAALRFDGQDDYVEVQNSPTLNVSSFTAMAWVRIAKFPSSYGVASMIVAKGTDDTQNGHFGLHQYFIEHNPTNPAIFHSYLRENNQFYTVDGITHIALVEWYHVAGTYDGTTLKLYVDGVLEDSNTIGITRTYNPNSLYIGALSNPAYGYWMNGIIDEVKLYSRALNQKEILTEMMQTSSAFSMKLYGDFDYSSKENAKIKLYANVENTITMQTVSNANITIKIYYPNGTLWISENMTERFLNLGIYEWESDKTVLEMSLNDGVYLALADVWAGNVSVATDLLPFHISSPLEGPVGPQGEQGPQGIQGTQGTQGEKGDISPYPVEAVAATLGLSVVAVIASLAAVGMFYRMKKMIR